MVFSAEIFYQIHYSQQLNSNNKKNEKVTPVNENIHNNMENNGKIDETNIDNITDYVYSLFPSIYSPHKKFHERLWESFLVHHLLLSIFTDNNIQSRLLNAFELMTLWSFELFMVAFFYELQYPIIDCENFLTMETCIERRTLMDSSQSLCKWNTLNKISCNNNDINEPIETVILVTILIVVLATPIILIISYTFDELFILSSD